jgi:hypothetical protein
MGISARHGLVFYAHPQQLEFDLISQAGISAPLAKGNSGPSLAAGFAFATNHLPPLRMQTRQRLCGDLSGESESRIEFPSAGPF